MKQLRLVENRKTHRKYVALDDEKLATGEILEFVAENCEEPLDDLWVTRRILHVCESHAIEGNPVCFEVKHE